jgi:hypothetical protein
MSTAAAEKAAETLRAVTENVLDEFTSAAVLFTALDVSNAVKRTLPEARHREISPLVRDLFDRGAMGEYQQTLIDVMAGGSAPAKAFLYHLPEHPATAYDDAMRTQLSIPPAATSRADDDKGVTAATTERRVKVGKDGRGRVSRRLLANAGITGDQVTVTSEPAGPRLLITNAIASAPSALSALDGLRGVYEAPTSGQVLTCEHPALLHLPRALIAIFGAEPKLLAKLDGATVVVVPAA